MSDARKADALDWDLIETKCQDDDLSTTHFRALIELRARVEALEAQQRLGWRPLNTETVYGSKPAIDTVQLTAQPGGLVERVVQALINSPPSPGGWKPEARAAIREVAAWLDGQLEIGAVLLLEQELDND
jgi:hypothetical protein